MKKLIYSIIVLFLVLIGLNQPVYANTLKVQHIETPKIQKSVYEIPNGKIKAGKQYAIWNVQEIYSKEIWKELNQLSYEELVNKYGEPLLSITDEKGNAYFNDLVDSNYYGFLLEENVKSKKALPFLIRVENDLVIYPKIQLNTGSAAIEKRGLNQSGSDIGVLQGVVFRLYEKNSNEPIRVKEGIATTDLEGTIDLVTDENGIIKVSQLLPGKYIFLEEETLSGYDLSKQEIEVEVVEGIDEVIPVKVYNKQRSERPNVDTGDSSNTGIYIGMAVIAFVIFVVVVRNEKKEKV